MTALTLLLIALGPFLVVSPIAVLAEVSWPGLLRPAPRRVARPRPVLAVAW